MEGSKQRSVQTADKGRDSAPQTWEEQCQVEMYLQLRFPWEENSEEQARGEFLSALLPGNHLQSPETQVLPAGLNGGQALARCRGDMETIASLHSGPCKVCTMPHEW